MPPTRPPLVVLCGDSTWDGHRLAAQHIAERLTAHAEVLYVEQPRSPVGRLRRPGATRGWWPVPRPVAGTPGLFVLSPLVNPGKTRRGGRALAEALARTQVRRAVRRLGGPAHAVIQIPIHHLFLGCCGETVRAHLASDDFVAAARQNGVDERWVRAAERRVAATATHVLAVTDVLADRWRGYGFEPTMVPNGCDVELYAAVGSLSPADDVTLTGPIAGFIGTLSDRIDVELLAAIADRGHSMLLVGPRSFTAPTPALDALFERPNVQWVGSKHYTDVPRYLQHMAIGLVPYRVDDFNRASLPLKALDYLAAGRAVVSTDIPSLAALHSPDITIAADRAAFVEAVSAGLAGHDDAGDVARRRALARQHSWDARVSDLVEALGINAADGVGRSR